jgi:Bardet-Biedl syndrome 2 protein
MLNVLFESHLQERVLPHLVTTGRFLDGSTSLAFANSSNTVLIYSPFADPSSPHSLPSHEKFHRIAPAEEILALSSGRFPGEKHDSLFLGFPSALQAYDVVNNKDSFYVECMDGASTIAFGELSPDAGPLVLVGGSCTVQGYDRNGADAYWTSTGDNVSCLCVSAATASSPAELCVGSEDYNLRWFEEEVLTRDVLETATPVAVAALGDGHFAYALSNGSVGVYAGEARLWHARSSNAVRALASFDIDGNGQPELVIGWASGRWEIRNPRSGMILCKSGDKNSGSAAADKGAVPLAGVSVCQWGPAAEERPVLLLVWEDGSLRGYGEGALRAVSSEDDLYSDNALTATLRALQEQKVALQQELAMLKQHMGDADAASAIPAQTRLVMALSPSLQAGALLLSLRPTHGTLVRMAAVFSNVVYCGEIGLTVPPRPVPELVVPIDVPRLVAADLSIKCVVCVPDGAVGHVFEVTRMLPKYAMFAPVHAHRVRAPQCSLRFPTGGERPQRLLLWVQHHFTLDDATVAAMGNDTSTEEDAARAQARGFSFTFVHLRSRETLALSVDAAGLVEARCDDLSILGEVVRDLASWYVQPELAPLCALPTLTDKVRSLFADVAALNKTRTAATGDLGGRLEAVRVQAVLLEDARLRERTRTAQSHLEELRVGNEALLAEQDKRGRTHQALMEALKAVNEIIQLCSRLRVGASAGAVTTACRKALAKGDAEMFIRVINNGK